jgi:hypothetical protein
MHIDPDLHKRLRIYVAMRNTTIRMTVEQLVRELLDRPEE